MRVSPRGGFLVAIGALVLSLATLSLFAPTPAQAPQVSLPSLDRLTDEQAGQVSAGLGVLRDHEADPEVCDEPAAQAVAAEVLRVWSLPSPTITFEVPSDPAQPRGFYQPGTAEIVLLGCQPPHVLVHEVGHYVFDLAAQNLGVQATQFATQTFGGGSWIQGGSPASLGVEYAAHCIGNVLWGEAPGTRCPDPQMRERATQVLLAASGGPPVSGAAAS